MKQTSLNFITSFLFDEEIKNKVVNYVQEKGHLPSLRVTWSTRLVSVPTELYCPDTVQETIWILIRNEGDIELRSVLPLDEENGEIEFDRMPISVQRAIGIFIPKTDSALWWTLFQNTIAEETSEQFVGGIKTFRKERKSIKQKRYSYKAPS